MMTIKNVGQGKAESYIRSRRRRILRPVPVLDSFYTRHNDDFKIDTVQSPDYTRIEYSSLTYSVFNSANNIQSDTMIGYQFNARDSRIYYWPLNTQEDNDVYHNIQNLTDTRLVFADYLPDGAGSLTSYVYFFHAQ